MRHVFISYYSAEAKQAAGIVEVLEKQGIRCWIAPRDIRVGSNYTMDIPSAIRQCPCFLLVLSQKSQNSKWVNKELTYAITQDKLIVPLMIEDFSVNDSLGFLLGNVQTRLYYQARSQIMQEVTETIQAVTGLKPIASPALPDQQERTVVDLRYENHPELNTPYFGMDGTESIRIPFAIDTHNTVQYFEIGGNTSTHALIVGDPGTGKSTALHTLILQTIKNYHPDDVEIWAMDYKGIEFSRYNQMRPPHYRSITNTPRSRLSLRHLIDFLSTQFDLRTEAFRASGVRNIVQYRKKCTGNQMPRILVIIDDCDLLYRELEDHCGSEYLHKFEMLLRVSRTAGFSFIFSSQSPCISSLKPAARNQIRTHLYFRSDSSVLQDILSKYGDGGIAVRDIQSAPNGQCIFRQSFWDLHDFDGHETVQHYRVNILYIEEATAHNVIRHAAELVGENYPPKSDIIL